MSDVPPLPLPEVFNARLKDLAPTVVNEQIGELISFHYNPVTTETYLTFNSRPFVYVNGTPEPLAGVQTDVLSVTASDVQTRCFGMGLKDPVTGQDLSQISSAGFSLIIKAAFDLLYNERAKAQGYPGGAPYPSVQAMAQANALWDMFGSGTNGFPLGKFFGGPGVTLPNPPATSP